MVTFTSRSHRGLRAAVFLVFAGVVLLVAPARADALTVDVTTTADGGAGSLRQAVADINAAGAGPHVINLAAGQLYQLTDCEAGYLETEVGPVTINGNGSTIEQTCPGERIWRHNPEEMITFNGITIAGGDRSGNAGGIKSFGPVTINDSTIRDNQADGSGGGVWVADDDLWINRSTFVGNRADDDENDNGAGGAFHNVDGTTYLSNSTVTGNYAYVGGGANSYYLEIEFSTLVGNESAFVGSNVVARGIMTSFGSVFADPQGFAENCANDGTTSNGYNWADDDSCMFDQSTDTEDGTDPGLGPLANNGGPTETMLPTATSPLVDAIPSANPDCTGTDQRGVSRPQFDGCDIGAVELSPDLPPDVTTTTTTPTTTATTTAAAAAEAVTPRFTG